MSESNLEKTCVVFAKDMGYETRKISYQSVRGAPDRIFMKKGRLIWVEFKTDQETGVISESQKLQQEYLIEAGQEVYNCQNFDDFAKIIQAMIK